MFSRMNRIIVKHTYTTITTQAYNNKLINRLEYITEFLKKKKNIDIYVNEKETKLYIDQLKKEKQEIFKKMTLSGNWNKYMNITKDYTYHIYT